MLVRLAVPDDLAWVKPLADRHKVEIGFVLRSALLRAVAERRLLVLDNQQGFCHYRTRLDQWTVIYEIVSECSGGGRALLAQVPQPLRLKCPVDLPANAFYARMGGELLCRETGRKRPLNVWFWMT